MENCSLSSGFEASNLINGFHSIPHVDIDLNRISSDFQISLDYFEASWHIRTNTVCVKFWLASRLFEWVGRSIIIWPLLRFCDRGTLFSLLGAAWLSTVYSYVSLGGGLALGFLIEQGSWFHTCGVPVNHLWLWAIERCGWGLGRY